MQYFGANVGAFFIPSKYLLKKLSERRIQTASTKITYTINAARKGGIRVPEEKCIDDLLIILSVNTSSLVNSISNKLTKRLSGTHLSSLSEQIYSFGKVNTYSH